MVAVTCQALYHRRIFARQLTLFGIKLHSTYLVVFSDVEPLTGEIESQRPLEIGDKRFHCVGFTVAISIATQQQHISGMGSADQKIAS